MHIHILGICGTFMGGIAVLAKQAGHRVTGCDSNVYPPMSTQLEAQGIELIEGFDPQQLALDADIYVVGNVVSRGNPLIEEILNRNLPYISGPQWLAQNLLQDKWVLAVAGTHGKTTTASMLAWILEYAGLNPGFLIGGVPQNFGISARLGSLSHGEITSDLAAVFRQPSRMASSSIRAEGEGSIGRGAEGEGSPFFVIEADEYDTAFFDKRSKFVHYHPRTAILNNLEFDHADIFADLAAIETQFHHLVRTIPGNGLVVSNGREESLQRVIQRGCWTPVEKFSSSPLPGEGEGLGERVWHMAADNQVYFDEKLQGTLQWEIMGEHNRMNALAALAAARHAGVPVAQGLAALTEFKNVKRRMEIRGVVKGITVYDDFAHHPTAIATTIEGLRHKVGKARILAVLEPRSNTMKLGVMKAALPDSLKDSDMVFCYGGNLGWNPAEALAPLGNKATVKNDLDELVTAIAASAKSGDQILVMSNGGFGGIHEKLLRRLAS
ncbi:MAG: UDP-N-acetylmuramate:L-alanyl-gamma-D-glutamyl-meso-diaminopimelate ligase [Gallionellaceae bacterium]|nr:UDP-N-acetylmuramate:L-alanyl-gamma-D-glutamyl-meso-diaminopimelate ligase [Gallionellaceae bacterium]